jgi:hypothetical protein
VLSGIRAEVILISVLLLDANIHIRELEASKHGTGRLHRRRVPPILVTIHQLVAERCQSVKQRELGGQRRVGKMNLGVSGGGQMRGAKRKKQRHVQVEV